MIGKTYTRTSVTGLAIRMTVESLKTIGSMDYARVRDEFGSSYWYPVALLGAAE
nr:hypothetical protein [uncultured Roseateles sp.]